MQSHTLDTIRRRESGRIFASINKAGEISLISLGTFPEVRHRFNQVVCLVGAFIQLKLRERAAPPMHSRSAAPGTWTNRCDGAPVGDVEQLLQLASAGPSEASDRVGYQAVSSGDWPVGATTILSGFKLSSDVFYGSDYKPSSQIGQSHDLSACKRAKEALAIAKLRGNTIYEEQKLVEFLDTLATGRFLHFFHQVHGD
jgi:hypothetical protein